MVLSFNFLSLKIFPIWSKGRSTTDFIFSTTQKSSHISTISICSLGCSFFFFLVFSPGNILAKASGGCSLNDPQLANIFPEQLILVATSQQRHTQIRKLPSFHSYNPTIPTKLSLLLIHSAPAPNHFFRSFCHGINMAFTVYL